MAAAIEVELKTRVDDPGALEARVRELADPADDFSYADEYFTFADAPGYQVQRFRLRQSGGRYVVTAKEPVAGAGANREYEFEVSDPEAFRAFCRLFGFRELIRKEKRGRRYVLRGESPPLSIELCHLPGLGDFLELEILVEIAAQVPAAEARLLALLDRLGVDRGRIEPAAYTRLLYNARRGA